MENLQHEEMPPQWMWPFEDELEIWFQNVEEERKSKYGGDSGSGSDDSDGGSMLQNDLAKGRGR